jgi:hypothetical protein
MMKQILFSFITLTLLSSCSLFQASKSNGGFSCRKYKQFIETAWKYDESQKIFVIKKEDLAFLLEHKSCLIGMKNDEVKELLGKPNTHVLGNLRYYLNTRCNEKPQKFCHFLDVYIDKKNGVVTNLKATAYEKKY